MKTLEDPSVGFIKSKALSYKPGWTPADHIIQGKDKIVIQSQSMDGVGSKQSQKTGKQSNYQNTDEDTRKLGTHMQNMETRVASNNVANKDYTAMRGWENAAWIVHLIGNRCCLIIGSKAEG